jgi:RHS repeat-associated protein
MTGWHSTWGKGRSRKRACYGRERRPTNDRTLATQFAYNGDGVRISNTVDSATSQYALDLAATLPVVISDTESLYLYGLDIVAQQQSERLYYLHDGLGSVRQLLDSTGDIETNYAYDPFGVPVVGGDVSNPYQYTGEAWDGEVELLYLRARYYQPEVGRFVTKDPWERDVWRPGLLNLYSYVGCNPVNRIDRSGMDCQGPGCPCPTTSPTAVPPECIPTGSVAPAVTPGTGGVSVTPTPVPLPYPRQNPSPCSIPTAAVVPTPVAESTWTSVPTRTPVTFWTRSGPWKWTRGEGPQAGGVRSICPKDPPLIGSRQMYGLADQIDAFSSGAEWSGVAEWIGSIFASRGRPDVGAWAQGLVMVAPDLATGWLRTSADYYRECGY